MTYKLTDKDFEYYRARFDEIRSSQILNLMYHVLPGAGASGFISEYTKPEEDLVLIIDEREDQENLFIGGVLISRADLKELKLFVNKFKKKFRPELNEDSWFLKGSGKCLFENEKGKVDERSDSKEEALTRWVLWSKSLTDLKIYYQFHSCTLAKNKYIPRENSTRKKNIERYAVAYENLFDSLEQHKYSKIQIITDNLEGAQRTALEEVSEKYLGRYNNLSEKPLIAPKKDFSTEISLALQFVDMQIYAMSRFIYPSGKNVLMDFENIAQESARGNLENVIKTKGDYEVHLMDAKYHIISDIFHHLKNKFITNLCSPNYEMPISSMVLVTNVIYRNFGYDVSKAVFDFCNIPQREITFDLTIYE